MYCNKCGKEIPSDSMYCPHCGNKLVNIQAEEVPEEKAVIETQRKKTIFPGMLVIGLAVLTAIGVFAVIKMTETPDGPFDKTFSVSTIDPSIEATDNDLIKIPMITEHTDYGINASSYEELGGFGEIKTYGDATAGVSSVISITCREDNTFDMQYYDNSIYGDYYFDKEASSISFYVDGNEYWGQYDGKGELLMWSADGSRFVFREVK